MMTWLALITAAWASETPWRLVGAYDGSAIAALAVSAAQADAPGSVPAGGWLWQEVEDMALACGPSKRPTGLGVMEAEAMAGQLGPMLVVVLAHDGPGPVRPLRRDDVRVALGTWKTAYDAILADRKERRPAVEEGERSLLYPAVVPRRLAIRIDGQAELRAEQLARTQIQIEACMEHKLGRAWTGRSAELVRQALLLQALPEGAAEDRRYFVGQGDPLPALLGPPDACLVDGPPLGDRALPGASSTALVPSDVWGAALRPCPIVAREGGPDHRFTRGTHLVPLSSNAGPVRWVNAPERWSTVEVALRREVGAGEDDVRVAIAHDGVALGEWALFKGGPRPAAGAREMLDILERVPYEYPLVEAEGKSYTLLFVPGWQLAEAARRFLGATEDADQPLSRPLPDAGPVADAVAWILDHPEHLLVQVRPSTGTDPATREWPDLWTTAGRGPASTRFWGYTAGMLAGRAPVFVLSPSAPDVGAVQVAQRAVNQGLSLLSLILVLLGLWTGVRRVPQLWRPRPTERADYWPGVEAPATKEDEQPAPELVMSEEAE